MKLLLFENEHTWCSSRADFSFSQIALLLGDTATRLRYLRSKGRFDGFTAMFGVAIIGVCGKISVLPVSKAIDAPSNPHFSISRTSRVFLGSRDDWSDFRHVFPAARLCRGTCAWVTSLHQSRRSGLQTVTEVVNNPVVLGRKTLNLRLDYHAVHWIHPAKFPQHPTRANMTPPRMASSRVRISTTTLSINSGNSLLKLETIEESGRWETCPWLS